MNNPDNYAGGSHEMRHDRPHDPDSNYELPLEDAGSPDFLETTSNEIADLVADEPIAYRIVEFLRYPGFIHHVVNNYFNVFPYLHKTQQTVPLFRYFIQEECIAQGVPLWLVDNILTTNKQFIETIQQGVQKYCSEDRQANPYLEELFVDYLALARNVNNWDCTHLIRDTHDNNNDNNNDNNEDNTHPFSQ